MDRDRGPEYMNKQIIDLEQDEFLPRLVGCLREAYPGNGNVGIDAHALLVRDRAMRDVKHLIGVYQGKFARSLLDDLLAQARLEEVSNG